MMFALRVSNYPQLILPISLMADFLGLDTKENKDESSKPKRRFSSLSFDGSLTKSK